MDFFEEAVGKRAGIAYSDGVNEYVTVTGADKDWLHLADVRDCMGGYKVAEKHVRKSAVVSIAVAPHEAWAMVDAAAGASRGE